ncbi:MAG TPA: PEP-CTERM sorting domain-containing protein [Edaphobacter sp.]|nr:PEP-CTERM sorting domain-containing protein [Edaphobacter sp.]
MKRFVILFVLISACFAIPAHADNIQNFYLDFAAPLQITGYITVDTTTGVPLRGDVFVYNRYNAFVEELNGDLTLRSCGEGCQDFPNNVVFDLTSKDFPYSGYLEFQLPTTLVGYQGGEVCSGYIYSPIGCSRDWFGTYLAISDVTVGINGRLVPTPEPSTLFMLGSGGIGLLGVTRRRLKL